MQTRNHNTQPLANPTKAIDQMAETYKSGKQKWRKVANTFCTKTANHISCCFNWYISSEARWRSGYAADCKSSASPTKSTLFATFGGFESSIVTRYLRAFGKRFCVFVELVS